MNLNENKVIWAELRQELKTEFRKISILSHPDKCENLDNAKIAFQVVEKSRRSIKAYIDYKENKIGEHNPFKQTEQQYPRNYSTYSPQQNYRRNQSQWKQWNQGGTYSPRSNSGRANRNSSNQENDFHFWGEYTT